jgi:hypothetical protein
VNPTPSGPPTTGSGGTPSAQEVAIALAVIDAVDLSDEHSVKALVDIQPTSAAVVAASQRLAAGASGDALWAATYVYAEAGTDPEPLLKLTASADPTISVLAAAGLASLGRTEGLAGLVASVSSDAFLRGSHPPATVARFAAVSLARYTADAVPSAPATTADEQAQLAAAWGAWLTDNRARLAFDAVQRIWLVK